MADPNGEFNRVFHELDDEGQYIGLHRVKVIRQEGLVCVVMTEDGRSFTTSTKNLSVLVSDLRYPDPERFYVLGDIPIMSFDIIDNTLIPNIDGSEYIAVSRLAVELPPITGLVAITFSSNIRQVSQEEWNEYLLKFNALIEAEAKSKEQDSLGLINPTWYPQTNRN